MHCVILVVGCVSRLWNPRGALPPTTRTLQWAETLNGYSLQSLDDRQQNFRFRPHMVLTMLFSWAHRQRNRKNSIFFFFYPISLTIGRENFARNIYDIFKKKIWESCKFLLNSRIKEYYYNYGGNVCNFLSFALLCENFYESKYKFILTQICYLNSEFCKSNFPFLLYDSNYKILIMNMNFPFPFSSPGKFYSFKKKKKKKN